MNLRNLFRIARKDWIEVRSNRELLLPLLMVPTILSILLPLILAIALPLDTGMTPQAILDTRGTLGLPSDVTDGGVAIIIMANSLLKPYLLIIPTMVAMIIAADSIAGEKERKTIESFLVLPLTDREILIGKVLGALIPSLVASWISFLLMGVTLNLAGRTNLGNYIIVFGDALWWLLEILLVTILSFTSTLFMVLISAKVRNVKAAQQYAAVVVIPIIGLVIGGMSQVFLLDLTGILFVSGIFGGIALGLAYLTTKRLNREKLILAID